MINRVFFISLFSILILNSAQADIIASEFLKTVRFKPYLCLVSGHSMYSKKAGNNTGIKMTRDFQVFARDEEEAKMFALNRLNFGIIEEDGVSVIKYNTFGTTFGIGRLTGLECRTIDVK